MTILFKWERLTPGELGPLLENLRQHNATELILLGPLENDLDPLKAPPIVWRKLDVIYQLTEYVPHLTKMLSELVQLRSLDLRFNQIQDADVQFLSRLRELTFLDLSHNKIGTAGVEALKPLKSLTSLKLTNNHIGETGVPSLAALSQLNSLHLGWNYLGNEGASSLASLEKLRFLDLRFNKIGEDGAESLAALRKLTVLNLFNNCIGPKGAAAISKLGQLRSLNLWNNRVGAEGAAHLKNLTQLTSLHLGNNQIGDDGINELSPLIQLTSLRVGGNEIGDAAVTFLSNLTQLISIDLSSNSVGEEGARSLAQLTQLLSLDLSRNNIGDNGAESLKNLSKLTCLRLSSNNIGDEGAHALSQLRQLKSLDLSCNYIGDKGTESLSTLPQLTSLCLMENEVGDKGARAFSTLVSLNNLIFLDLSKTKITDLSGFIPMLEKGLEIKWHRNVSRGINVYQCPLDHPPPEIVQRGNEATLNYLYETKEQGSQYIYEAKVLIVGQGGAGKTSLLRRLYQTELPLPSENESTKGIDIHRYDFCDVNGQKFYINIWDFGAQQIYHATHQFFFTKRSLYILVDDTRSNNHSVHDEGFKEWLEMIETLSDRSPVLIFQNEKGGRSKSIDEESIKSRFTNVKGVYRGNLMRPDAALALANAIRFHVQELPHVREQQPAGWVAIRSDLEEKKRLMPYISAQDYFQIYERHLEFDEQKAYQLSRYFHDLGVLLHFDKDEYLADDIILQNDWATEAVFSVLNDEIIKNNSGYFTMADCDRIWADEIYAGKRYKLIALMVKFELCYKLPDRSLETWLVPQLLSPSMPEEVRIWPQEDDLVLTYHYDFLPKGLINRLMIRKHHYVLQVNRSWRNGSYFEAHASALLAHVVSFTEQQIELRARGPDQKLLLTQIEEELDLLNMNYPGLENKVRKYVPCICSLCKNPQNRAFKYEKRMLYNAQRLNFSSIQCHESFEMVMISDLLDDLNMSSHFRSNSLQQPFLTPSHEHGDEQDFFS